ncbi:hypothetical protein ALQ33_04719, partial [Pseudomonas syringae pv. philadelphi]
ARRPASHPPDQRQDSAVTYVAIGVVSATVIEKHIKRGLVALTIVPALRVAMQFVTLCVTRRFCGGSDVCLWLEAPFCPSASCLSPPDQRQDSAVTYVAT